MDDIRKFRDPNPIVFENRAPGFEHGLEQTVLSGPGLQLLNPSPRDTYQDRLSRSDGSVSEVYQLNSRWRGTDLKLLPSESELGELRTWFLNSRRTYVTDPGATTVQRSLAELPLSLGQALAHLSKMGQEQGLMYVADLVLLYDGRTWLLPAGSDVIVMMRKLPPDALERITAVLPECKRDKFGASDGMISVSTVPWRVEVTHGPRGYRTALLESGLLLAQVMQVLQQIGADPVPVTDFVDSVVDGLLDQDGVERFSTALVGFTLRDHDEREGGAKP